MVTEAQRSLTRIGSNYLRLLINIVLGLVLVRILLATIGTEAWGLIALLGSTIGLAAMLSEIVNASMVRELGEAYHTGDDHHFREVYNSALLLTALVAVASIIPMGVVWSLLGVLNIPDHLLAAGRWLVMCKAAETLVLVVTAAPVNQFKVSERMVAFNSFLLLDRLAYLAAALCLLVGLTDLDPATGVRTYATISAALVISSKLLQVGVGCLVDRRTVPAPGMIRRTAVKRIVQVGGWNTATVTAMSLHLRIDSLIMNLFFGLFGNVIFSLTSQLASYVRMVTSGMTDGVDAVSARISSSDPDQKLRVLLRHSTRLHGMISIPAALGMFILAEPILLAWVGDRLDNPEESGGFAATEVVGPTVLLIRVLMLGMLCRSIGDGWIALLYGAGHIRRYAPSVLIGGLANPLIAVMLIILLPDSVRFIGPALSYSTIFLVVNLVIIPLKASAVLEVRLRDLYSPLVRPAIVTVVCSPILIAAQAWIPYPGLGKIATQIGLFGVFYGVLTFFFVFDSRERDRLWSAGANRLARQDQ